MTVSSIERLNPLILAMVGSDAMAAKWWTSPNKAFNNECPCYVEFDIVRDYLVWHAYCAGG